MKAINTLPFKIRLSEDTTKTPQISSTSLTKAELRAIIKDFPKVMEDPHRFAEKFSIVTIIYHPGLSNLHQLVHMLVREGQAQTRLKLLAGKTSTNLYDLN